MNNQIVNVVLVPILCIAAFLTSQFLLGSNASNLGSNEAVYFVNAIKLIDNQLFLNDWTISNTSNAFGYIFSIFLSIILFFSNDLESAALIARFIQQSFVVCCFLYLARTLNVPLVIAGGALIFFIFDQDLAAGAWVFRGAEQKVFAYGFVFLSLAFVNESKFKLAGLAAGLAFISHVIVGGWSALVLGALLLFRVKRESWQPLLKFAYTSLPFAVFVVILLLSNGPSATHAGADTIDVARSLVEFRNPHHLDPSFFLDLKSLLIIFLLGGALLALKFTASNTQYQSFQLLLSFTLGLWVIFIIGVAAKYFNIYELLIIYPFRLFDSLFLLFSTLLIGYVLYQIIFIREFINKRLIAISAGIVLLIWSPLGLNKLKLLYWKTLSLQNKTDVVDVNSQSKEMMNWIKLHTDKQDIFIVNPCKGNFWVESNRGMIVNYKLTPVGGNYSEWLARLKALNNGEDFSSVGFKVCREIDNNYNEMSHDKFIELAKRYSAKYLLLDEVRTDWHQQPDIVFGRNALYKLQ
ncbi:DUF6798 domain-containing protein [Thalassotalea montiporae]